jgi:hypothetical protein
MRLKVPLRKYREALYVEDVQAWLMLEQFILVLRARVGLDEADAAELVCRILLSEPKAEPRRAR